MPIEATIAKAQTTLESNDITRAKEIIRSSLHNYNHGPKILEFYGEILLRMGKDRQAGRYFFYSVDEAQPHQKEAIESFLSSHKYIGYKWIIG